MPTIDYPPAPTSDQVDDYHGTRITDPYRPLEDSDAPESRAWIAAQNALTQRILGEIPPRRGLGLPAHGRTVAPGGPLVPDAQYRPAGPGCPVGGGCPGRRGSPAHR